MISPDFSWNFKVKKSVFLKVAIFSLGTLLVYGDFKKFVEKIQFSITADEDNGYCNKEACVLTIISL
jgi:hypothetical protein